MKYGKLILTTGRGYDFVVMLMICAGRGYKEICMMPDECSPVYFSIKLK